MRLCLVPDFKAHSYGEAQIFAQKTVCNILAHTLWGQIYCGQTQDQDQDITKEHTRLRLMAAIGHVIMNRTLYAWECGGYWWGNGIVPVCMKPAQFACWNPANAKHMRLYQNEDCANTHTRWDCLRIARLILANRLPDPTQGATHYEPWETYKARTHKPRFLGKIMMIHTYAFYRTVPFLV